MLKDFLFEIECAEKIGNYKLADAMDKKLFKMASSDKKTIQKQIVNKFNGSIKDIHYSTTLNKFIIAVDSSLNNKIKTDIKSIADPFNVSFRYSQNFKDIDSLMGADLGQDPLDKHLQRFDDLGPDHIGVDYLDDIEPTDDDLRFEAEHPADELSDDPNSMDSYWVDHAHRDISKLFN